MSVSKHTFGESGVLYDANWFFLVRLLKTWLRPGTAIPFGGNLKTPLHIYEGEICKLIMIYGTILVK